MRGSSQFQSPPVHQYGSQYLLTPLDTHMHHTSYTLRYKLLRKMSDDVTVTCIIYYVAGDS